MDISDSFEIKVSKNVLHIFEEYLLFHMVFFPMLFLIFLYENLPSTNGSVDSPNFIIREIIRRLEGCQKTTIPLYYFNIAFLTILAAVDSQEL